MRKVVKPLEGLLTSHKRIVVKDSAVSRKRALSCIKQCLFLSYPPPPSLPPPPGERGVLWSQGPSPWSAAI